MEEVGPTLPPMMRWPVAPLLTVELMLVPSEYSPLVLKVPAVQEVPPRFRP